MKTPRYTALAASLPSAVPFVGPETQERAMGQRFKARLGANENSFGPSPKAISAMQNAAAESWMYGDPESYDLRQALSIHHQIPAKNIMVGEGIDCLLGYLVRLLIEPGDTVVTSQGAYPTFNYHVTGFGGTLQTVPYNKDHEDPLALMQKAKETGAKLVYLANPDNPMGSWHTADRLTKAISALPDGCVLVLDEAYIEFAPKGTAPALDLMSQKIIRMRTFSKAYGLAGARIGYAIAHHDLIDSFNKIRNHFGLSRISQAAALAALNDQDYLSATVANVAAARHRISQFVQGLGLTPLPSATNFVTVDCGRDGAFARRVLQSLSAQGIFIRMPFVAPQDRCIRVSAGTPAEIDLFEQALPLALIKAKKEL